MSSIAGFDPLRVLIVGCGNIAGGFDIARPAGSPPLTHAGAYRASELFEIAACVDPDSAKRQAFMRRWSVPEGFADVGEALASQSYDVVSICSPTETHADHLRAALGVRPRAVFCEKPITRDVAETAALVEACEAAGVLMAVNHTRRWDPEVAAVRNKLAQGEWGQVRSVTGYYMKGALNNGTHMIDLIRLLLGDLRIVAVGQPVLDYADDDPTVPALLSTKQGIAVHLSCGHAADFALFELNLVLEAGTLTMEDGGFAWRTRSAADSSMFSGYRTLDAGSRTTGRYESAMSLAVQNIHAAVTTGEPLASTGRTALAAQVVCDDLIRAAREGLESS